MLLQATTFLPEMSYIVTFVVCCVTKVRNEAVLEVTPHKECFVATELVGWSKNSL